MGHLHKAYGMSERRACRVLGVHRRTVRYQRHPRADEAQVRERLRALAAERPRWGYRRLHILLQRELGGSHPINHKCVQRLYCLEGRAIRCRKRKRVVRVPRGTQTPTWRRGEAWAIDFMLAAGRMCWWTGGASARTSDLDIVQTT